MKKRSSFFIILFFHTTQPVIFTGLIESGITKNNFLCSQTKSSSIACTPINNVPIKLHDDQIIQLFNDQAYWLHQEANTSQYDQTVLAYSTDQLSKKLAEQGWSAMGGYCIIITVNQLLANIIAPKTQPKENEKKIIAQLWYNGKNALELWSQDVAIMNKDQSFQVSVSNSPDALTSLTQSTNNKTFETQFLSTLNFQPNNRDAAVYNAAIDCPRSIKIQESTL